MAVKFQMNKEGLKVASSAISMFSKITDTANAAIPEGDAFELDVTQIVPALCDLGSNWCKILSTQDYVTATVALNSLREDTEGLIKFYQPILKNLKKNLALIDKAEAALSESVHNTAYEEDD